MVDRTLFIRAGPGIDVFTKQQDVDKGLKICLISDEIGMTVGGKSLALWQSLARKKTANPSLVWTVVYEGKRSQTIVVTPDKRNVQFQCLRGIQRLNWCKKVSEAQDTVPICIDRPRYIVYWYYNYNNRLYKEEKSAEPLTNNNWTDPVLTCTTGYKTRMTYDAIYISQTASSERIVVFKDKNVIFWERHGAEQCTYVAIYWTRRGHLLYSDCDVRLLVHAIVIHIRTAQ